MGFFAASTLLPCPDDSGSKSGRSALTKHMTTKQKNSKTMKKGNTKNVKKTFWKQMETREHLQKPIKKTWKLKGKQNNHTQTTMKHNKNIITTTALKPIKTLIKHITKTLWNE